MKMIMFKAVLCILISFSSQAQISTKQVNTKSTNKAEVIATIKLNSSDYIVSGLCEDSLIISANKYSAPGKNIFIAKQSANNIALASFIKYDGVLSYKSITTDASGNIYVVGNADMGITVDGQTYSWSGYKCFLTKINAVGIVQWTKLIGTDNTVTTAPYVSIGSNELVVVVNARDSVRYDTQVTTYPNSFMRVAVLQVSLNGQINSIKDFYGTHDVRVTTAPVKLHNDEMVFSIGAFQADTLYWNANSISGSQSGNSGEFLLKLNSTLTSVTASNFIRISRYANAYNSLVNHISASPVGDIYATGVFVDSVAVGSNYALNTSVPNPPGFQDNFIVRFDKELQLKWIKGIGTPNSNNSIAGLVVDSVGNLFVAGSANKELRINNNKAFDIPGGNTEAYVVALDTMGNKISERISKSIAPMPGIGNIKVNNIELIQNGLVAISGSANVDVLLGNDSFAQKSTNDGIVWVVDLNSVSVRNIDLAITKIRLYPNPAINTLYWHSDEQDGEAFVYNTSGQIVLSDRVSNNSLNVNTLSKGIYLLRIKQRDKIYNGTFIKQ